MSVNNYSNSRLKEGTNKKQVKINWLVWFICFGLSFLSERCGLAEQGVAFFYIFIVKEFLLTVVAYLICILAAEGKIDDYSFLKDILSAALPFAILLFAIPAVCDFFGVDYYVAFQIITLGHSLPLFDVNINVKNK